MLCPHCKVELKIADRSGIEIDYCPQCRGVWLDRGELDKILERAGPPAARPLGAPPAYQGTPGPGWRRDDDDDDDDDDRRRYRERPGPVGGGYGEYGRPRRRRSWLGDLFDFD